MGKMNGIAMIQITIFCAILRLQFRNNDFRHFLFKMYIFGVEIVKPTESSEEKHAVTTSQESIRDKLIALQSIALVVDRECFAFQTSVLSCLFSV